MYFHLKLFASNNTFKRFAHYKTIVFELSDIEKRIDSKIKAGLLWKILVQQGCNYRFQQTGSWTLHICHFPKKICKMFICHYQGGSKMILSILSVKLLFKINKKG